jgi:hypothetical protein
MNFQFSMTFNFNIFLCFSNIRNHLSDFSYLVCNRVKFLSVDGLFLKTENSRRVVESRDANFQFLKQIKPSTDKNFTKC